MGLDLSMYYRDPSTGADTCVGVDGCYQSLGSIDGTFWGSPGVRDIGVELLAELAKSSPIFIEGWDAMHQLGRELALLAEHLPSLDERPRTKAMWLANLTYCYQYLRAVAPKDSVPQITIG